MEKFHRQYGYWDNETEDSAGVYGNPHQSVSGYPIGILCLDVSYPLIPGNVVNAYTYDFPVRIKVVKGATTERIFRNDRTLLDDFIQAGKELESEGVRAISGACGYFANFQKELAESLDVPVFSSALCQAPWIRCGLRADQKVGIIASIKKDITPELLQAVGITDPSWIAIEGLENTVQFSALDRCEKFEFNNSVVRKEVVDVARKLAEENNLGAILLECSDIPCYAADIQRATNLPVFDYISMIRWMHHAVAQRRYNGFI